MQPNDSPKSNAVSPVKPPLREGVTIEGIAVNDFKADQFPKKSGKGYVQKITGQVLCGDFVCRVTHFGDVEANPYVPSRGDVVRARYLPPFARAGEPEKIVEFSAVIVRPDLVEAKK